MAENKKPSIRFKGFTDAWEQRKLGSMVIDHNAGIYISKEDYGSGTNVIGVGNIYDNDIFDGEIYRFGPVNDDRFSLEENDLIYGESSLVPEGIARTVCVGKNGVGSAFAWHTRRVKLDQNIVNSHFATLELNYNTSIRKYLMSVSTQTALTGMTTEGYFGATLMLPSVKEQASISDFFKNLDHLITLHQRKYEKLKNVKKSMLEKMFPKNGSDIPEIRFKGFTDAWEQCKLFNYLEVSTLKNKAETYGKEDVLSVSGDFGIVNQIEFQGRSFAGVSVANYGVVETDDVVYTKSPLKANPYGIIKTNKGKSGIVSTLYAVYKPRENTDSRFIQVYFEQDARMNNYMHPLVNKGAKNDMKVSDENALKGLVCFPHKAEQNAISGYFNAIDHLITLHQCEQNAKISIKNIVLLALFTENEYNCAYYFKKEELFMTFKNEADFENALIKTLTESFGWEKEVLKYKTEKELLDNWKTILFENNRQKDRLNDYPLTDGEMQQIIEQIKELKTPLKLNGFINGRSVLIKRDNPDDKDNFGKEVSLKIYDRNEIAAGQSRYQIAQQPVFKAKSGVLPDRRGDLMLLINGMPVIHIELKRSGKPVSEAYNQIEKYSNEGIFTGLFALVQVFVAMTPEETVYFANPGIDGVFNPQFYFHWADFNNEPIKDWKEIASQFLSIPMAHELIGYYTVADDNDGILKIMRSYQIIAAKKLSDRVAKNKWEHNHQLGGYIWHTTGSGKTMTSFKSAQLIANTKDADKVIFLIDRIELGTQSAREYRGFADDRETIQETEDTEVLVSKLKSPYDSDTLIVTSIQKMSNIRDDDSRKITEDELKTINSKRIVFIVDECHRSSFGDMMLTVKQTFSTALFFGFTGTPIQIENMKKGSTTADVFGDELHRYSIADGIRDKNVLGFDIEKVLTFKEKDMRVAVALEKAKAKDVNEATSDPKKSKIFYKYMNEVPMASYVDNKGITHTGIEDYMIVNGQYRTDEHQKMVVDDIVENWQIKSHGFKFHGIFATSSIPEAIDYYRLFKKTMPELNVTCLFDQHIDNDDVSYNKEYRGQKIALFKEEGLIEIIEDYKTMFGQSYSMSTYDKMKKDIQARLAHKKPYERIAGNREQQLDLLIVVDQMLTGYDSKWINILYLDKLLKYENIIQAFSRTNRLFNENDKPFGCVKYYRAPFTMEKNIQEAVKVYSGDKPFGLFVQKLDKNIENMNAVYTQIENLFNIAGVDNFSKLPDDKSENQQFAKLFKQFNNYLNAAKIQGFKWEQTEYQFVDDTTGEVKEVKVVFDKKTYLVLVLRYKELFSAVQSGSVDDTPYDLTGYITTIDTDKIDADYMNSRFEKYRKALINGNPEDIEATKEELHKTFATLTQDEQKYANIFLHDMQNGDIEIVEGKSLRDYINEYMESAQNDQIHRCATAFGLDEHKLRSIMALKLTDKNINEFNRLDKLMATVDMDKAQEYFSKKEGKPCARPFVIIKLDKLLTKFIISGGFEI